jgi:hypothetical protein
MSSAPTLNIREAIDEITLAVAHPGKDDLSTEISEQAMAYMAKVLPTSRLMDDEIERRPSADFDAAKFPRCAGATST